MGNAPRFGGITERDAASAHTTMTNTTFPARVPFTREEMMSVLSDTYKSFYGFRPRSDTYANAANWADYELRAYLKFLGNDCEWISREEWDFLQKQEEEVNNWFNEQAFDWY